MEVDGHTIRLKESEVSRVCPVNPTFAASQVRLYGPEVGRPGSPLAQAARCPDVLMAAGYKVEILPDVAAPDGE